MFFLKFYTLLEKIKMLMFIKCLGLRYKHLSTQPKSITFKKGNEKDFPLSYGNWEHIKKMQYESEMIIFIHLYHQFYVKGDL